APASEDQCFLRNDGGLGFGFLCQPLTGADTTASDRLNVLLTQDWPKGTVMQVGLWAGPDTKANTHDMMALRGIEPTTDNLTPAQATIQSRYDFIDSHRDRKSTRLNSSHVSISYAVFC